jgi:predicted PurR-regulated permease PerM
VVDLDWRSALALTLAFLGIYSVFVVFSSARQTITWIGIGTLLAVALNPLVTSLEQRLKVRRGIAVGTVLAGLLVGASLVVLVLGPPAIREAQDFRKDLPHVLDQLTTLPIVGQRLKDADAPAKVQKFIDELPSKLGQNDEPVVRAAQTVLGGVLAISSTLLVAVAMLLDGQRVLRGLRRAVALERRPQFDRMGDVLYRTIGRYFAGSLFVATLTGLGILMVGLALGVPLAPLAGLWASLTNLIPQIGGFLGGSFFVLLGFSKGTTTGILCLIYFLIWQQLENHVITPTIVGEAVDLSPPVTMLAALIGGSAAGVPGALVAVPLLGSAKAIFRELRPGAPAPAKRSKRRIPLPKFLRDDPIE